MKNSDLFLSFNERVVFALRSLYSSRGYSQYKMSKFEEYDLYAANKDFLISDSVITFTDTNGKLMAHKPDVTLSIIKNIKDEPDKLSKVFYNETFIEFRAAHIPIKKLCRQVLNVLVTLILIASAK